MTLTEEQVSDTTTKFIGDIQFKVGDSIRKASELLTLSDLDGYSQGGRMFDKVNGYPNYYVKHGDINVYEPASTDSVLDPVIIMKISLPTEFKSKLLAATLKVDVFKIHMRNLLIMDWLGNVLNDFIISVENGKFVCPELTHNKARDCYTYSTRERENPEIMFDKDLNIEPYTWYLNGDITIHNLLNEDSLVSHTPIIKCDIIDADNALKLQKSDVYYFYRPSVIDYDAHVKYMDMLGEEELEYECECYRMVYKIPDTYEIPTNLTFKFKEYCFGNSWALTWDGNKWIGDNMQGKFQSKIIAKCKTRNPEKDGYGATGCMVAVKRDTLNSRAIPEDKNGLAYSLLNQCSQNGKYETLIQFRDGSVVNGSDYELVIGFSSVLHGAKMDGYDLVSMGCNYKNYSASKLKVSDIELLYLDLTLPGQENGMRLSFTVGEVHREGDVYNRGYVDLKGALDTIERVSYVWSMTPKNTPTDASGESYSNRDIVLYLRHDYTDPIDEVSWDPSTNAFEYIIKQQFYEVSPNPNAATTLYTDFNITSSKIITADNITTMRSDLNLVTNNVDVVSYDVKDVKSKVDALGSEMTEQQAKTKYLEKEVDKIDMKANVGIALGAVGCVLGATGIGVAGKALSFAQKGVEAAVKTGGRKLVNTVTKASDVGADVLSDIAGKLTDELPDIGADVFFGDMVSVPTGRMTRAVDITEKEKLDNIIAWCDEEYVPVNEINFTDELDDPSKVAMTLTSTMDMCKRYRHTMKPIIKTLAEGVEKSVSSTDLVREDTIDVVAETDGTTITLTAEDTINNGMIVFRIFIAKAQKNCYFKFENGEITEYKGVEENITLGDVVIKPLARSEEFKAAWLNSYEKNGNTITIQSTHTTKISGVVIQGNSCTRNMTFTTNDLAYTCDIDAIHKKIDALAANSHNNDAIMTTALDDFPTVDEVNAALDEIKNSMVNMDECDAKYALKSDIPTVANEYALRIDLNNLEDIKNIQTNRQTFALLVLNGFTLKGTKISDNTSIDFKCVPNDDYENDVYATNPFVTYGLTYYFHHYNNSNMIIRIMSKGYDQLEDIVTFMLSHYNGNNYEEINITELYFEERTEFDSKEAYCKEIIDSKFIPKTDLFKIITACDNQYVHSFGESQLAGNLTIYNNIYNRNDSLNLYSEWNKSVEINFGSENNYATLSYIRSLFRLLVNNAEIIKYDGSGTTINGNLAVTGNITSNTITELNNKIAECDNKYALKSEIPDMSTMSAYRKMDNLDVYTDSPQKNIVKVIITLLSQSRSKNLMDVVLSDITSI